MDHDHAALARTIYTAFNERRVDDAIKNATPDVQIVLVPFGQEFKGPGGFREFMGGFHSAFPDIRIDLIRQQVSREGVTNEFQARGTHTQPLQTPAGPVPPTGKKIDYRVCEVWTVRDGKLTSIVNYFDAETMMRQLGLAK